MAKTGHSVPPTLLRTKPLRVERRLAEDGVLSVLDSLARRTAVAASLAEAPAQERSMALQDDRGIRATRPGMARKRLRYGRFPKPTEKVRFPWAMEHQKLTHGDAVQLLRGTDAWKQHVGAACEAIDEAKRARRGPKPKHPTEVGEIVRAYGARRGCSGISDTLGRLTESRAKADRELLCLLELPSESWFSHHRDEFDDEVRAVALRMMMEDLRAQVFAIPEVQEHTRLVKGDGIDIRIKGVAPKFDRRTGEISNAAQVTVLDAGYCAPFAHNHGGDGYRLVWLINEIGIVCDFSLGPMSVAERDLLVHDLVPKMRPLVALLPPGVVRVATLDGVYADWEARMALRSIGYLDNIHNSSHSPAEDSVERARQRTEARYPIFDPLQPELRWYANGHGELSCHCGKGRLQYYPAYRGGVAGCRIQAICKSCGSRSFTSGKWRRQGARGKERIVQVSRDDLPVELPDPTDEAYQRVVNSNQNKTALLFPALGNPYTFNSEMAELLGKKRFGRGEGANKELRRTLGRGNAWFASIMDAYSHFCLVSSTQFAITLRFFDRGLSVEPEPALPREIHRRRRRGSGRLVPLPSEFVPAPGDEKAPMPRRRRAA